MNSSRTTVIGAIVLAFSGLSAFGQYDPQQVYSSEQRYPDAQGYQSPGYAAPQLENLLAPIALYPDSLLSQVLVASTYPQQLAEAGQWLSQAASLPGQQRLEAAQEQDWDPSIQALVAFPDVLQRLTQDLSWTTELGNAFVNSQADVMNAVQHLRARAQQAGRLQSTQQQIVNVAEYNGYRAIEIVSADPEVVYVPTYNPVYIWGAPAYGFYPSLYYPSVGFGFGRGITIGAFFGGYRGGFRNWGWGPNWRDRRVIVNNDFFYRNRFNGYRDGRYATGSNVWRHDEFRGNGNYRQQSFRSNQIGNSQYRAPAERYTRQLRDQPAQQQARPLYAQPQAAGQNYGRRNYTQQSSYDLNRGQQEFRFNQGVNRQGQHLAEQSARRFNNQAVQQRSPAQYTQPQAVESRAAQPATQQFRQSRSFEPRMQQQYAQPQIVQPRSFQQQVPQQQLPQQQQYARPQFSQPPAQRSEQRGFARNGAFSAQQPSSGGQGLPQYDRQAHFGGRNR